MISKKCCWYLLGTCDLAHKCNGKGDVCYRESGTLADQRAISKCMSRLTVDEAIQEFGEAILGSELNPIYSLR